MSRADFIHEVAEGIRYQHQASACNESHFYLACLEELLQTVLDDFPGVESIDGLVGLGVDSRDFERGFRKAFKAVSHYAAPVVCHGVSETLQMDLRTYLDSQVTEALSLATASSRGDRHL